jgi:hypothetical protein
MPHRTAAAAGASGGGSVRRRSSTVVRAGSGGRNAVEQPVSPGTAAALRAAAGLSPGRRRSAAPQQVVVTFASGELTDVVVHITSMHLRWQCCCAACRCWAESWQEVQHRSKWWSRLHQVSLHVMRMMV